MASDVYRVYITSWGPWLMVPIAVIVFFICERSLTVRHRHRPYAQADYGPT